MFSSSADGLFFVLHGAASAPFTFHVKFQCVLLDVRMSQV